MKTERLNEYIFTEMVMEIAQAMRRTRQKQMELDGANQEDIANTPITIEDRQKAISVLESERQQVVSLLEEIHSDCSGEVFHRLTICDWRHPANNHHRLIC